MKNQVQFHPSAEQQPRGRKKRRKNFRALAIAKKKFQPKGHVSGAKRQP